MPQAQYHDDAQPISSGGASCGRHTAPWLCVFTKPNQERLADYSLRVEGFPTYLPLHMEIKADRSGSIQPLFPRYMFAQPDENAQWVRILFARGVSGVLRDGSGNPRVVPTEAVDRLLAQCAPNLVIYPPEAPRLRAKGAGRVTGGPLADFTGICTRDSRDRVWLLLTLLGRPTEVEFARELVEAVG